LIYRLLDKLFFLFFLFFYLHSLGDIQYDLEEAAHVRAKLVKMYESVDIIRWVNFHVTMQQNSDCQGYE